MSDALDMDVAHAETSPDSAVSPVAVPTPLLASIRDDSAPSAVIEFDGKLTASAFRPLETELRSLLHGCGIYDLGWRSVIAVRGEDRLRWLSGMVTNAVQQLADGEGNYSFLLNAQGRIQGDAFVYREAEQLLLDTTAEQVQPLLAHLDRFIIMDDVTLEDLSGQWTAIGLAGVEAAALLNKMGMAVPEAGSGCALRTTRLQWDGNDLLVVSLAGLLSPRVEILCSANIVGHLWQRLVSAGAAACGIAAVEGLRILEGLPRFGVDIVDRDLPQETSQTRALNFNKGCYLGQEIVERIRSRGAVHRSLRQFRVSGNLPELPAELMAAEKAVGKLTSAVPVATITGMEMYGLGIVRADAIIKGERLTYNGGEAEVLDRLRFPDLS